MKYSMHLCLAAFVLSFVASICPVSSTSDSAARAFALMPQVPASFFNAYLVVACLALLTVVNLAVNTGVVRTLRGVIAFEVDTWFLRMRLYKRLPELRRAKVLHDMQLIEQQYAHHPYHGPHHAADVVGKCGAMLRRDRSMLRRWARKRACKGMTGFLAERQQALFDLAVILAAAFHDAGHPGVGNGYLASSKDARFENCNFTAEQWSVNWFKTAFMQQQSFLDDLPAADRAFVEDVASYAVLQTDMRVHGKVLSMTDPDETDPLKRLAALLLHAADLANGADSWSVSKLWAQWCHQEFHSQGDTSRQEHPELDVLDMFNRDKADMPKAQLGFLEMFVEPTFKAMAKVCPKTAAQGLHGCAVNAAECRAIMQLQAEQQLPRML